MSSDYPTTYAYDLAVADLASLVESLWVYKDAGMVDIVTVLEAQVDADTALTDWAVHYGIEVRPGEKEDLVEVLRELREHNAKRFQEEVKNARSTP